MRTAESTDAPVRRHHERVTRPVKSRGGLEDYILDSAGTQGFSACVFTGPVNRDDDHEITPGVLLPREFWKLVVMVDADRDRLHATAYLLSQGELIRDLLRGRNRQEANEGFVLGSYRTFQIAVRDLAEATGYDLAPYVDADPLTTLHPDRETTGAPSSFPWNEWRTSSSEPFSTGHRRAGEPGFRRLGTPG